MQNKLRKAQSALVVSAASAVKKTVQPKAYSLADLQLEASNKYGFSAEETLNVCHALYETHKIASYPRSDCQFLPESQLGDAPKVIKAIASTAPSLKLLASTANPDIRSATWNDKKITAHHGIVPTQQTADWDNLSDKEKQIYTLILKRYLAQFLPEHEYLENKVVLDISGEKFSATGKSVVKNGWKAVYAKEDDEDEDKAESQKIPQLKQSHVLNVNEVKVSEEKTKAPSAFTEGTLIAAMERIHTVVDNPEHKKFLKESDGIGTPATRAAIISELKRKQYLEVKGKKIHATALGLKLLSLVPEIVKNPILTAIFERKLKDVEKGNLSLDEFINSQKKFVLQEVNKQKKELAKREQA